MKFVAQFASQPKVYNLFYDIEACAFDMSNHIASVDCDIIINYLTLQVLNDEVIYVSGFCGYKLWKLASTATPSYNKGSLMLTELQEDVYVYSYSDDANPFPVWFNPNTEWICVGDSSAKGTAVEFIHNCVAVLNDSQDLVALWLKPKFLNLGNKTILEHIMS